MKRLYRSQRDRKIFGICGGLAEQFNIDATLLRLLVVIAAFFSGGVVIPIYILAALVIPKEPTFGGPFHDPFQASPFGGTPSPGGSKFTNGFNGFNPNQNQASQLDEMMKDVEKKAMKREIEELKAKLAKLEKGDV
ncbi:PspC domain-containing protein [Paenibacillus gansuensis]|uniref:PspC domain-containing protein n=1 Tax=Paenibacillus gansuensis TaxID=306542 RepID=A0ABW5PKI2_9BACL